MVRDRRMSITAVMDMWKSFRNAAAVHAPQAAILFDNFHIMRHLGEALDKVRKSEYARLSGKQRRFFPLRTTPSPTSRSAARARPVRPYLPLARCIGLASGRNAAH